MPLYEYYCEPCNGVFEMIRPMREAAEPVPCPECIKDAPRIMSSFTAFTFRDGYPRRIPDKGTFWHMGKEVKKRARKMKGWEHPELAQAKPAARPGKGEIDVKRQQALAARGEAVYRDRWGVDQHGMRTLKAKKRKPGRKTLGAG
jgi:putative FmdB family regulatory protein